MNHDRRQRRGRQAMDAAGILPGYRGCAVHDFWESYLDYDCGHAFCNGHLLRELIFLWQEQDQKWAKSMIDHLLGIKDAVATARTATLAALPDADLDRFLKRYERIVEAGNRQALERRRSPQAHLYRITCRAISRAMISIESSTSFNFLKIFRPNFRPTCA